MPQAQVSAEHDPARATGHILLFKKDPKVPERGLCTKQRQGFRGRRGEAPAPCCAWLGDEADMALLVLQEQKLQLFLGQQLARYNALQGELHAIVQGAHLMQLLCV